MSQPDVIYWFRQDLRLADNPALHAAARQGKVLPIYILDETNAGDYVMGAASRVWLHHSLTALDHCLQHKLSCYVGQPLTILQDLCQRYGIKKVFWNRCYEPWRVARDSDIKQQLQQADIMVHSFNGSLLWEPWDVKKADGTPYKVFTPYYRNGCRQAKAPREPLPAPKQLDLHQEIRDSVTIDELALLPKIRWDKTIHEHWLIGEQGAEARLHDFLEHGIIHYKEGRDFPARSSVSRLSPHLHFGELSPNQAWFAVQALGDNEQTEHFCRELAWREFSYSLLYYFPELPTQNLQSSFDRFPWQEDKTNLRAWQTGHTGIPMVDAGMRELWQTGYMHNRVRMIVGSFLVKNLLLHWHYGERWFWDCLLDADLANNSASWQWVAGCGADAAPYFRIFNPVTQGQKFDPEGEYVRQYIPELAQLPNKYLFNPWEAPESVLKAAGVVLGKDYPQPIVDLKASRNAALAAYEQLRR